MTMNQLIEELPNEMKTAHGGDQEVTLPDIVRLVFTLKRVIERHSPIPIDVHVQGRPDLA